MQNDMRVNLKRFLFTYYWENLDHENGKLCKKRNYWTRNRLRYYTCNRIIIRKSKFVSKLCFSLCDRVVSLRCKEIRLAGTASVVCSVIGVGECWIVGSICPDIFDVATHSSGFKIIRLHWGYKDEAHCGRCAVFPEVHQNAIPDK